MKTKVKRITNHSIINKGKKTFLLNHFASVKDLKNRISKDIFTHIQNLSGIDLNFKYQFMLAEYLNSIDQNHLTKNELQKVAKSIGIFYEEYIQRITQNKIFQIQSHIQIIKYKKSSKKFNYQVGDIKSKYIITKKTLTTSLIEYIKYIDINTIQNKKFNFSKRISSLKGQLFKDYILLLKLKKDFKKDKLNDIESKKYISKYYNNLKKQTNKINKLRKNINDFVSLDNKLHKIYLNENTFKQLIQLLSTFQENVKTKIKLIELTTGSYIKVPVFNKNKVDKNGKSLATKHSYIFKDESNKEYKHWFKFKTPGKTVYIPLAYNHKYHNNFKDYLLDKEVYISLSPKNKININLNVVVKEPIFLIDKKSKLKTYQREKHIIGIDLNVRDNFLVFFNPYNKKAIDIDYDRTYINDFIKELHILDKLSSSDKKLDNNKNKLEKLVRVNEWYFKKLISQTLNLFKENKIYEIVMEDLDLSKSSASFVKSKEFQIKYSRLIRLLRLGSIKDWMKLQGEKLGIKVHLINPAYTSQECSKCHFIHKSNRNGDTFKCNECCHSEHSDFNASKNILNRCLQDVLVDKLSIFDEYERGIPNSIGHKKIKNIIHSNYGWGDDKLVV